MISAEDERAKTGTGKDFVDVVSVEFCDAEREVCGCVRVTRLPSAQSSRASAIVFVEGDLAEQVDLEAGVAIDDWVKASVDGVRMATEVPLERWSLETSGERTTLQLAVTATSPPGEYPREIFGEQLGVTQYEQLCRLRGTAGADGQTYEIDCLGRRVHCWGEFAWGRIARWRTLYAASPTGRAISVAAALPVSSEGHGQEVRWARVVEADDEPPIEDVRASTVYGEQGFPEKAGLELWVPDAEFPRRLGGEAICGTRIERPDETISVAFFRWSIDGDPAYGSYEVVERR